MYKANRLDDTKKLADAIQATSGVCEMSQLGTNDIATPIDGGLEEFNKGSAFGFPNQNYYITEAVTRK